MAVFLGFDTSIYPGDAKMELLRQQGNVAFTGFYLGPAPSHEDSSWMGNRQKLQDLGYGFAPIYVGRQQSGPGQHILTADQGTADGQNAVQLAGDAGFPEHSVLYLDIESGPPIHQKTLDYYKIWVEAVAQGNFTPGVYCSHLIAAEVLAADPRPVPWVFRLLFNAGHIFNLPLPVPDPSSRAGFSDAQVLQYAQNCIVSVGGTTIKPADLDTALTADPSSPSDGSAEPET